MSRYQLSIIKLPSGRFGFVGSVPKDLAVRHKDGTLLSDAEFKEYCKSSNPSMVKNRCGYIEPRFETREAAINFAKRLGFDVKF